MCVCISDLWGYCPHDYNYKTVSQLVFLPVDCAVQGGNLLLNIGPRPDGSVLTISGIPPTPPDIESVAVAENHRT
jgi:hypothetical protein